MSAVRASYDLVRTWEDPDGHGFKLELFDTYQTSYGKPELAYKLFHQGRLVFEGDAYSPGAGMAIDGDQAVGGLLAFLSLKPGDTDREYFESYTPEQMAWAKEWGEVLSCYVEPLENPRGYWKDQLLEALACRHGPKAEDKAYWRARARECIAELRRLEEVN